MLKDYLELEWNSESSGAGFRCVPRRANDDATVGYLLEADLRGGGGRKLPRTRSMSALTKISAVFNAVRLLPFAAAASSSPDPGRSRQEGSPSRSFSERLRGSFWRRKGKEGEENRAKVRDIVRLRSFEEETGDDRASFDFPSPVVSSCSSFSESDSFGSGFLPSSIASSETADDLAATDTTGGVKKHSPRTSPSRSTNGLNIIAEDAEASVADHRRAAKATESQSEESPECHSEEKEQLSPVSVMDFPSEEDEEEEEDDTTSPSFHHSLAKLETTPNVDESSVGTGTKLQLLQQIRRFECLADLDPIDLDRHFASCDDRSEATDCVALSDVDEEEEEEEEDVRGLREKKAWGLLGELKTDCHVGPGTCVEKVLVDFFIQGLSCSGDDAVPGRPSWWRNSILRRVPAEQPMLDTSRDWIEGKGCRDLDDYHGEATLREMERNGKWRCFEEEEAAVAADVEDLVLGSLTEELVVDLALH
ncbi:hypothetical protein B296_00018726 [Ensete ventricosum]|uniref:DUF4378 domain-containing protein n=1 Tax=Ensete ventricosum TaxID=4639 RepID=A0A427B1I3_ENSVE|nr:hypothetical protein B296_00018726 [Ensete ventricosum]